MTTDVASVGEHAPYRETVAVLAERGVSAVPVLDVVGHVVGVVSEADLLHKVELTAHPGDGYLFEGARRRSAREKAAAATARELMNEPAVTIMGQTSVVEGARRMDEAGVKRLPVIDELGRLVGIVSRGDLLKVFLQPDSAIIDDANLVGIISRRDILRTLVHTDLLCREVQHRLDMYAGHQRRWTASVDRGEVAVDGTFDDDAERHVVLVLARTVPGVLAARERHGARV